VFVGGVGLGKSHLAAALSYEACQHGHSVFFTTAIDAINNLIAAQAAHRLKSELKKYLAPDLLCLDELGYLPLDKTGADLLFQIISQRLRARLDRAHHQQGLQALGRRSSINDSGITSAILDRLLHHAETVLIEGKSYRTKDQPSLRPEPNSSLNPLHRRRTNPAGLFCVRTPVQAAVRSSYRRFCTLFTPPLAECAHQRIVLFHSVTFGSEEPAVRPTRMRFSLLGPGVDRTGRRRAETAFFSPSLAF